MYGKTVYILGYTDVVYANVFSTFRIWKQIYRFFLYFRIFCWPYKQNCEKIQKVKTIKLHLEANEVSLINSSSHLYFNLK